MSNQNLENQQADLYSDVDDAVFRFLECATDVYLFYEDLAWTHEGVAYTRELVARFTPAPKELTKDDARAILGTKEEVQITADMLEDARGVLDDCVADIDEFDRTMQRLQDAARQVHSAVDAARDHSVELCCGPDLLFSDIARVCEILKSYTFKDETEFCLLREAIRWQVDPLLMGGEPEAFPGNPREIVGELQRAIDSLRSEALSILEFPFPEIPRERVPRIESIIWQGFVTSHNKVIKLLQADVDRWIYPRLGTHPDQWTSRLSGNLWQLRKAFQGPGIGLGRDNYVALSVSPELAERVRALCDELAQFRDELIPLRFDSLPSALALTQKPSGSTDKLEADTAVEQVASQPNWIDEAVRATDDVGQEILRQLRIATNKGCFVPVAEIARSARCSKMTIRRRLTDLKAKFPQLAHQIETQKGHHGGLRLKRSDQSADC